MLFGNRLRVLREEKGITQKQLGEIINISDRVIGYYESNDRFPKDENVLKGIAKFFNVSVDYLVGNSDIRNPYKEDKPVIPTKAYHNLDKAGLPEEAIRQIEEYIEFVKQKYTPDGTLRKRE